MTSLQRPHEPQPTTSVGANAVRLHATLGLAAWVALLLSLSCSREQEPEPNRQRATLAPVAARAEFEPTHLADSPAPTSAPTGMVWIPGGEFSMGSADPTVGGHCHEPMDDARPIHRVSVSGFFMDQTEVTNESFARFVAATGYVTVAERRPSARELPGVPDEKRVAG